MYRSVLKIHLDEDRFPRDLQASSGRNLGCRPSSLVSHLSSSLLRLSLLSRTNCPTYLLFQLSSLSWSLDHLLSIPSVQLSNLQTLSITRSTPPFSLFPVPPLGHEPPPPDDVCAVKPIPESLYEALLAEGTGLRVLELDWWEVSSDQVSKLAKTLTNLEKFKFELDAPFSKLVSLKFPSLPSRITQCPEPRD